MTEEKPTVVEIDCTTGESVVREMTEEEISNRLEMEKQIKERLDMEAAAVEAKEAALDSATQKLSSLGLNPSEIAAITGR